MFRHALAAVLTGLAALTAPALAAADTVTQWNQNAANALYVTAAQPPNVSVLHMAMVQGAVYDAVNAIDGSREGYLLTSRVATPTDSKDAAAATAAYKVLISIVPAQQPALLALYNATLAGIPDGSAETRGIAVGDAAAAAMIAARTADGRFGTPGFLTGTTPGAWRPVLPAFGNDPNAWVKDVKPFLIRGASQFRSDGPYHLTSRKYAREFNEVKALGAQSGSSRTEAQTLLAGFATANPVVFMNKGLRDISVGEGLSTTQQALLFVKTSMAAEDALIGCWHSKKLWSNWRPQTAIREAANDGNPATSFDDDWLSLFATPGYPDNPSGYNCYTAGLWHSARLFFGTDNYSFQLTSPGVPANAAVGNPIGVAGSTRSYAKFTDVIDDTIEGRILNGFHFRSTDVQGAWLGKKAAQWLDKHYFAPVD